MRAGKVVQGGTAALDGVAVSFGQKAGYAVATAFADDTSKDGAWGALRISKEGKDLLNWQDTRTSRWAPKEFGDGEGGYKEYLAAVAKDTRQVLLDMDLPGWADTVLNAIGDSPSIDSLSAALTQIGQAQTVFKSFGQYMTTFATLADSSVTKLAAASGGIGALAGNMGAFVDGFYTDAEKLAVNTANVREAMGKLGFELPATREEFKALVQSQIALGDAGAQTTAGLLAVSGAVLLLKRVGGWRHLADPLRGDFVQRWHSQVARVVLLGLLLSALAAWGLGWARTYALALVSERIGADLRTTTYEHLMRLSQEYFGGKRTGVGDDDGEVHHLATDHRARRRRLDHRHVDRPPAVGDGTDDRLPGVGIREGQRVPAQGAAGACPRAGGVGTCIARARDPGPGQDVDQCRSQRHRHPVGQRRHVHRHPRLRRQPRRPNRYRPRRAVRAAWALATSVLVGLQPVFTQVPPTRWRSMMATFIPAAFSRPARAGPACPAPIMMASNGRLGALSFVTSIVMGSLCAADGV